MRKLNESNLLIGSSEGILDVRELFSGVGIIVGDVCDEHMLRLKVEKRLLVNSKRRPPITHVITVSPLSQQIVRVLDGGRELKSSSERPERVEVVNPSRPELLLCILLDPQL